MTAAGAQRLGAALLPPLIYAGASLLIFGQPVVDHLNSVQIGSGTDPQAFAWILKWWPQAIAEGWDPLHTDAVFVPGGFNMMWVTSIPGPSLLLAPITQLAGPIASYNVLSLLGPVLSGWATHLLCRSLGAGYWASLLAGYVFAFSAYMVSATIGGHPFLTLMPFAPLLGLLGVIRVRGRIGPVAYVAATALTLTLQFLTSTETFLVLVLLAGGVLLLAGVLYSDWRAPVISLTKLTVVAGLITGVIVSPLLIKALSEPGALSTIDPIAYSTDPLNLAIPTSLTALGGSALESVSLRFTGNITEQGAYLGLPLLVVVALMGLRARRDRTALILLVGFLVVLVASLGPRLNVLGGVSELRLPWAPFSHLPIFEYVIPSRLIGFAWLFAVLLLALWLSRPGRWRWGVAALVVVTILPNVGNGPTAWSYRPPVPELFRGGDAITAAVPKGSNVVLLPYAPAGGALAMLWQAEADMAFRQAGGYVSATVPEEYLCWPLAGHMRGEAYGSDVRPEIPGFLTSKDVDAIIATPEAAAAAQTLLAGWFPAPREVGGMLVYDVPAWMKRQPVGACPPSPE